MDKNEKNEAYNLQQQNVMDGADEFIKDLMTSMPQQPVSLFRFIYHVKKKIIMFRLKNLGVKVNTCRRLRKVVYHL